MSNEVTKTDNRFELRVDGEMVGFADYRVQGERVVFPHTEIDPLQGVAGTAAYSSVPRWTTPARRGSRRCPRARSSTTTSTATRSTPTCALTDQGMVNDWKRSANGDLLVATGDTTIDDDVVFGLIDAARR